MRRLVVMGVLNVTPDSFSDGGRYMDAVAAYERGRQMRDEGADWIDVGGESTRPGAKPVTPDEEMRRVLPVIERLAREEIAVSIDTSKATVARAALAAGARMVNDVTALKDSAMVEVCAEAGCELVLMHMRGEPQSMQDDPRYSNVVTEVRDFLLERSRFAEAAGVARERIWIDPGIGFGKTLEHNLALLSGLRTLVDTGYPVLLGVSRKSFIGRILGGVGPDERLEGTLAAQVLGQAAGVSGVRVHDVLAARRAADVAQAILA